MGRPNDELLQLAIHALASAVDAFVAGEPNVYIFVVDLRGEGHTITLAPKEGTDRSELVEKARRLISDQIGESVQRYAIAYDTYLTKDGETTDAAAVEAAERGEPRAFLIAQRYRLKKRTKKTAELIGPPTLLDSAKQLLD